MLHGWGTKIEQTSILKSGMLRKGVQKENTFNSNALYVKEKIPIQRDPLCV